MKHVPDFRGNERFYNDTSFQLSSLRLESLHRRPLLLRDTTEGFVFGIRGSRTIHILINFHIILSVSHIYIYVINRRNGYTKTIRLGYMESGKMISSCLTISNMSTRLLYGSQQRRIKSHRASGIFSPLSALPSGLGGRRPFRTSPITCVCALIFGHGLLRLYS